MKLLSFLLLVTFFVSFSFGQFAAVSVAPGIQIYIHDVVAIGIIFVTFLQKRNHAHLTQAKVLNTILLFSGIAFVSAIINASRFDPADVIVGFAYLGRWVLYACVYLAVVISELPIQWWTYGLFGSGVSISILGIFQFFYFPALKSLTPLGWDEHFLRLFSTLLDPNFAGAIIVLSLILGMNFFIKEKKKKNQQHVSLLVGVLEIVQLIALGLTFSRSSFLAFFAAIISWVIVTKNKQMLIAIGALILIYLLIPKSVMDMNRLTRTTSTIARLDSYQTSISVFAERPLLGHGFNYLRALAKEKKVVDANGIISRDASGVNSSFLFVLETTGIIGGLGYLYLLYKQWHVYSSLKNNIWKAIGIASLNAMIIHSFFNHTLFYAWVMIWLWILQGIGEVDQKQ